uniref:Uncharacterized protein n=1 Tax=Myotis myotis TaxID=51298 RepID=A0A7J8AMC0_MYOMY|nr:hypothetical protein mMyoMyo1_007919 [Myotis myotis]
MGSATQKLTHGWPAQRWWQEPLPPLRQHYECPTNGFGLIPWGTKSLVRHPLRSPWLPEGCLTASLGLIPWGVGLSQQVDIPQRVLDCKWAQAGLRDPPPLSAQIFVHRASSLNIKHKTIQFLEK